jgi:Protein of unknown function (DUF3455)
MSEIPWNWNPGASCSGPMTPSKMTSKMTNTATKTAAVGFLLLSGVASEKAVAGEPPSPPKVPAALAVPAGAKLVARFHATGAQVYTCTNAGGQYSWVLAKPDATLTDASGSVAGTHGVGPTWTLKDGSSVVGKKVAQSPAPEAGAIPWLLLSGASTKGAGQLAGVTFVQRVATKGGIAPATGCDAAHVAAEVRANYSADYYFYKGGAEIPKTP